MSLHNSNRKEDNAEDIHLVISNYSPILSHNSPFSLTVLMSAIGLLIIHSP